MKCKNCGKIITGDNAMHCGMCGADYCEQCASEITICSCYSDFTRYN